jgi:hypothetical protein
MQREARSSLPIRNRFSTVRYHAVRHTRQSSTGHIPKSGLRAWGQAEYAIDLGAAQPGRAERSWILKIGVYKDVLATATIPCACWGIVGLSDFSVILSNAPAIATAPPTRPGT